MYIPLSYIYALLIPHGFLIQVHKHLFVDRFWIIYIHIIHSPWPACPGQKAEKRKAEKPKGKAKAKAKAKQAPKALAAPPAPAVPAEEWPEDDDLSDMDGEELDSDDMEPELENQDD